jgi:uncharacterized protein (TIGR02569 family)
MTTGAPPPGVLAAFDLHGPLTPLPGGQGTTWRCGDVVLKPVGLLAEAAWTADVLARLPPSPRYRVAPPVAARGGDWIADGWSAWRVIPGRPDPRRLEEVLRAGTEFHRAIADLPRPAFLDGRDDPWTYGERLAFGDIARTGDEAMADLLDGLEAARRPVSAPAQPVHGDLLGNVLFADGLPPAVIDWPVYHRPAPWALAVAIVDALTWHGAVESELDRANGPEWSQMLLRALAYRIATNEGRRRAGLPVTEPADAYQPVVRMVLARCAAD